MDEERCVPAHEENDVTPVGLAEDDDMLPEYEFDYSKGVRGKYYRRLREEGVDEQAALRLWPMIHRTVFVPHTDEEYERIVALLDRLIDEVGEDESNPLTSLMEVLGVLVEAYEDERVPRLSKFQ